MWRVVSGSRIGRLGRRIPESSRPERGWKIGDRMGRIDLRPLRWSGAKMRIERHYTKDGASPYEAIAFRTATSEIRNPDGSIVFRLENIEVPADWSQVAVDVLAQ